MQRSVFISLTTATVAISGCGTMPIDDPNQSEPPLRLATMTQSRLDAEFALENRHVARKADGTQAPRIGLALSGGGTKAGMFAHGVLHGLQQGGVLKHVHAISTTSGGGYAAYWYFSKKMEAARAEGRERFDFDSIFADCVPLWLVAEKDLQGKKYENLLNASKSARASAVRESRERGVNQPAPVCDSSRHATAGVANGEYDPFRWQAHIVRWPDVFNPEITRPTGNPQTSPKSKLVSYGFHSVLEIGTGLFGMEPSVVTAYEMGLERTWGLNPKRRDIALIASAPSESLTEVSLWSYTNAVGSNGSLRVDPEKNQWKDLRALYDKDPTLPVWILNTTQGTKTRIPNAHNLYEITPFSYGSSRLGYIQNPPPLKTITQGVRASAGFMDPQNLSPSVGTAMYEMAGLFVRGVQWGVDIPVTRPSDGIRGTVRLSDGGPTENTGALSLIRRGISDLIIADGAQDAEGRMEDLCNLEHLLSLEKLSMTFAALENFNLLCERLRKNEAKQLAYNVSAWTSPVIEGEITWPPTAAEPNRRIKVYVIKPAWDELKIQALVNRKTSFEDECGTKPNQVNCWLPIYFFHDRGSTIDSHKYPSGENYSGDIQIPLTGAQRDYMQFPQHGTVTATIDSSTYRFWAYRELGRNLAVNLRYDEMSGRIKNEGIQCLQHSALARKHGLRPIHRPITSSGHAGPPTECTPIPTKSQ